MRLIATPLPYQINLDFKIFSFRIPDSWDYILFNLKTHKVIYIFSDIYFFKINLHTVLNQLFLDPSLNIWVLYQYFRTNFCSLYWHFLNIIYTSFNSIFYKKLRFKGKGYHIFKNLRSTLVFRFNYAHKIMIYAPWVSIKFLSKTSLFFFGLNPNDIIYSALQVKTLRPINLFTMKGVRFAKQIIYKKIGKVLN